MEILFSETLENGCIVEHTEEGNAIRVTVFTPDRMRCSTALRTQDYIDHDPHYRQGINEQARGLLQHDPALYVDGEKV